MSKSRPYVDWGKPGLRYQRGGRILLVNDPPPPEHRVLTLAALRRHNTLQPALQPTDRILLRWAESGGTGLPNPDAERRETHYDPLPPDLQTRVDEIVDGSPWKLLAVKWYRTTLDRRALANELHLSKTQLYEDWKALLWYFRGRFEGAGIYG